MKITPFALERYFAKYEFSANYLLSSSDCDGLPMAEVVSWADDETKMLWENLALGYTESNGHPLLRQEVANLYRGITPEEVLIAAPEEGIFIALNTLLNPGDHVVCTWPGYQSLYEIALSLGCKVDLWQPVEAEQWRFDVDDLERAIQPNTRLIVINFPHNPTGSLPSRSDFDRIVQVARSHNLTLFSDEMYRFLEHKVEDRLPSAVEEYENAVSLFGMSKTFGMAGVRIGWLVTKNPDRYQKMLEFKDYTTICSSAPGEILSLMALRAKDRILVRHRNRIERNLSLLDDFFAHYPHLFSWVRPRAGTICFPRIVSDESASSFCTRVMDVAGIMLLPSTVYGYGDSHFRLGFGRENMPQVLKRLEEGLLR